MVTRTEVPVGNKYQFGKENWLSTGQPAGRQGQQTLSSLTGVILKFPFSRVGFSLLSSVETWLIVGLGRAYFGLSTSSAANLPSSPS